MSSKPISVVAVLHPNKGKADEVAAIMNEVAEYCLANEPGTLQYTVTKTLRPGKDGNEEIVMMEKYKDTESLKLHGGSAKFKAANKKMIEKGLIRAPPLIKTVSDAGGYASRL